MRIAIVHDSFTQLGGAERVVDVLHEMYPEAPVFTLVFDKKLKDKYLAWDIRTSWLQVIYNIIPKFQYLFPLVPLAVSSLKFDGFDLVISSSSSFAKNIKVPKTTVHISYCHTPTRFLWQGTDYLNEEVPSILLPIARIIIKWMRKWDYRAAQRVTHFVANSTEVQKRIKAYYNRDSTVIYPPVDTDFWKPVSVIASASEAILSSSQIAASASQSPGLLAMTQKQDYFLLAGRLQAHKSNELIIKIFNDLKIPLHVVGTGRQESYLRSISKDNIKFLGRISDEQLREEYSGTKAYIFPQLEDLGLMPLEAAACGTATIAYGKGGSLETVVSGVTGELFEKYDADEIKRLILGFNPAKYQQQNLTNHAKKFSREKFKLQIFDFINRHYRF